MRPDYVFAIGGAVGVVWGLIVAIRSEWAHALNRRLDASSRITVGQTRVIGFVLATLGAVILIVSALGVIPANWA